MLSLIVGLGCDRPFCGAYWSALGVTGSGSYPVCSPDTLRPVWTTLFTINVNVNNFMKVAFWRVLIFLCNGVVM